MDYYNFAFFFCLFVCLLPLSKPLHNSVAENINLLLYLLDLCPIDLVGGSGLRHWTQWMDLQGIEGSSRLLAPRAGSWCYPSCGSSAGLSAGAITLGLSTWLGFLMIWQLNSARECPKNKSLKSILAQVTINHYHLEILHRVLCLTLHTCQSTLASTRWEGWPWACMSGSLALPERLLLVLFWEESPAAQWGTAVYYRHPALSQHCIPQEVWQQEKRTPGQWT